MTFFLKSLTFIFFIPLLGLAQSNYKPGYVVLLTGDTLRGSIDFKEWNKNPKTISFRNAADGSKSTKYNADQIRYLDLDTLGAYQQFIGPITMDVIEESHLLNGRDSSYKLDTVLLRVLQKGSRMTLFSYSDQLKTRFYIQQPSDKVPQELAYRVYYDVGQSASGRTINENTYMRQLFAIGQQYNVMNKSLQWGHRTFTI